MENSSLEELFLKLNNLKYYEKRDEYLQITNKIYKLLNIDINSVKKHLNIEEEIVLLKSLYLILFYDIFVLKKPVSNLLYFISNEELLTNNIKNEYIEQAKILIKIKSPIE